MYQNIPRNSTKTYSTEVEPSPYTTIPYEGIPRQSKTYSIKISWPEGVDLDAKVLNIKSWLYKKKLYNSLTTNISGNYSKAVGVNASFNSSSNS